MTKDINNNLDDFLDEEGNDVKNNVVIVNSDELVEKVNKTYIVEDGRQLLFEGQ